MEKLTFYFTILCALNSTTYVVLFFVNEVFQNNQFHFHLLFLLVSFALFFFFYFVHIKKNAFNYYTLEQSFHLHKTAFRRPYPPLTKYHTDTVALIDNSKYIF